MDDAQKIKALMSFTDDASGLLEAIARFADALTDTLSGDSWHLAYAIREMAEGRMTPTEADVFANEDN